MNDSQIKQLIQSEIHKTSQSNRFNVANTQRHIHNNIDSPFTFQPILTYIGIVQSGGTASLLPRGWSVEKGATTGTYTINHSLPDDALYSVVASAEQSTNAFVSPIIEIFTGNFFIAWGGGALGDMSFSRFDTSFFFILTVINNKSVQLPTYSIA